MSSSPREIASPSPLFIYLHGLSSSPLSKKGLVLGEGLAGHGVGLVAPDLNVPSFEELTLTAQVEKVEALMDETSPVRPVVLIGSSLGGLVSLLVTNRRPHRVARLLLVAPAFRVVGARLARLAGSSLPHWRKAGYIEMTHFSDGLVHRLGIQLVDDAARYDFDTLKTPVPTLVLHGTRDEVIPLRFVERWVTERAGVRLVTLPGGDHSLQTCFDLLWEKSREFLLNG